MAYVWLIPKAKVRGKLMDYVAGRIEARTVSRTFEPFGRSLPAGLRHFPGARNVPLRKAARFATLLAFMFVAPLLRAQTVTAMVPAGLAPNGVAINPVTNKIYVVNQLDGTVTVIDGSRNTTSTVTVGFQPSGIAVNPVNNRIYVAKGGTVAVIDGGSDTVAATLSTAGGSCLGVNPVTNKIYVGSGGKVAVVDGATDTVIATATIGLNAQALAVNPVSNKIYVADSNSNTVSVIDGATDTVASTIPAGSFPFSVVVNPVTNKIYVANYAGGSNPSSVTVIDGANNSTTTVPVGNEPDSVAVNPVTNKIYVANLGPGANPGSVTVIDGATNSTTTVTVGAGPQAVAVNPITNQIYVANFDGSSVTVIDGATNATTTLTDPRANGPTALGINPVTNRIYVANQNSNNVSVIDGATYGTTTMPVESAAWGLAVNRLTNKIYVPDNATGVVSVVDGDTGAVVTSVAAGSRPRVVAVNELTNRIYVANYASLDVTVIDGSTDSVLTTIGIGGNPVAIAVNPVTNKIYVTNQSVSSVVVIDGATDTILDRISVLNGPFGLAVNSATNRIYVAQDNCGGITCGPAEVTLIDGATDAATILSDSNNQEARVIAVNPVTNKIYATGSGGLGVITVIDGETNAISDINVGIGPQDIAVNSANNKIYAANGTFSSVTVIDGITNSSTVLTGAFGDSIGLAVNPLTNKVYVANYNSTDLTVITEQSVNSIPLQAGILPIANNVSSSLTPTFGFSASSAFSPIAPSPTGLYFQADTWQGTWTKATSGGRGSYTGQTPTLQPGLHILYAYAVDGQEATSVNTGRQSAPLMSNIAAYSFLVGPPVATVAPAALDLGGVPVGVESAPQSVTISNGGPSTLSISGIAISGPNAGDFSATPCLSGAIAIPAGSSCAVSVIFTPSATDAESATLTFMDDSGGISGSSQTVELSGNGQDFALTAVDSAQTIPPGSTAVYNLQLSPLGQFAGTVSLTCSGAPPLSACSVKPSSVMLDGTSAANVTLNVTTTGYRIGFLQPPGRLGPPPAMLWLVLAVLLALPMLAGEKLRRFRLSAGSSILRRASSFAALLLIVVLWSSCVSGRLRSGTPAGTYTVTVTATSQTVSHSLSVTLIVQ
jgi:YVTN family beta-propeller protein